MGELLDGREPLAALAALASQAPPMSHRSRCPEDSLGGRDSRNSVALPRPSPAPIAATQQQQQQQQRPPAAPPDPLGIAADPNSVASSSSSSNEGSATPEQITIAVSRPVMTKAGRLFMCPYRNCTQGFTRCQNLRSHVTTHTNKRLHVCSKCPSSFRRRQELMRHERSVHAPVGFKSYQCSNCKRLFGRPDALKRHILANGGTPGESGTPPWICTKLKHMGKALRANAISAAPTPTLTTTDRPSVED